MLHSDSVKLNSRVRIGQLFEMRIKDEDNSDEMEAER